MKKLIAYYSRPGENYFDGQYIYLPTGITEFVAKKLKNLIGDADLFKIEEKTPYSKDYAIARAQAQKDLDENARPELKSMPENLDEYDEIYLGYPNFCGSMPMAVFTFLEGENFDGKVIHPFCTNEGDGLSFTRQEIMKTCPGAVVDDGIALYGSDAQSSEQHLKKWLETKARKAAH